LSFVSCQSWSFCVQAHHLWCFLFFLCCGRRNMSSKENCNSAMMGIVFFSSKQARHSTPHHFLLSWLYYVRGCVIFKLITLLVPPLSSKIPFTKTWPIVIGICDFFSPIVTTCVINQGHEYWLLLDVLTRASNCVCNLLRRILNCKQKLMLPKSWTCAWNSNSLEWTCKNK
jgi:hypothetical protein